MNLATIQRIDQLSPIEGADRIEVAHVLGWEVVVKKGEFQVGELVVYVQIDTVMPDKPEYQFLAERKFRVRTIKLRGQISQGLILPLNSLPNSDRPMKYGYQEGKDVTDIIGVKKYEKTVEPDLVYERSRIPKSGWKKWWYLFKYNILYTLLPSLRPKLRSPFPTKLVPITDEERIQNIPKIFETHKDRKFCVSYKLNGSSITIIHERFLWKSRFRICSRRFELHDKKNDWYRAFKESGLGTKIEKIAKAFGAKVVVQGELVGPKFNGNYHGLDHNEIRVFSIYFDGNRIEQTDLYWIAAKYELPVCPLYGILILPETMDEILRISEIPDIFKKDVPVEGLVWRCGRDSFKVINNDYLIKNKE